MIQNKWLTMFMDLTSEKKNGWSLK